MRVAVFIAGFLVASPLVAQTSSDDEVIEVVAISRLMLTIGGQVEYAGFTHVAPWISVRYGTNNPNCDLSFSSACGDDGLSAMGGLRLVAGAWPSIEPYVTLGLGRFWSESGRTEAVGTAHVGVVWSRFGWFRPRIEVGYEGHLNPWVNIGIGFLK
jgi:hypothetical protein